MSKIMPIMERLSALSPFRLFRARPRGRLVRDYFLISVVLIGGGLIASGVVEIYFRYQESREQLAVYQREVAAGDVIGVLQAEVNLKYIGDVVSNITVGKAGYAYAVTRGGELIAHPDISLVLQRRNTAQLEQVTAAFRTAPGIRPPNAIVAANLKGEKVFSSFAPIP